MMLKAFRANLRANLIFFRRNRLVALVAIFTGFIWCMTLVPSVFFSSANDKFQLIKMLIAQSLWFVLFFSAALAVMTLAYNFRQRCFKMVITKPCPPEIWLLAHLAATLLVAAVLYAILLIGILALFLVWHIPIQWGVLYLVADAFLGTAVVVSVLSFLISVMHPFIAVILMLVANESTFYGLLVWLSALLLHASTLTAKFWYSAARVVNYALYLIVPSCSLFEKKVADIHQSLRMEWADLKWLELGSVYTVLVGALFFALTALALRCRQHT